MSMRDKETSIKFAILVLLQLVVVQLRAQITGQVLDAEDGWYLRMDGMNAYGNSPLYERTCIHPSEPLVFFNMDGVPGATCLIWSM